MDKLTEKLILMRDRAHDDARVIELLVFLLAMSIGLNAFLLKVYYDSSRQLERVSATKTK